MKTGKIKIKNNKPYFEYYELKKPEERDFLSISKGYESEKERFDKLIWNEAVKEYKASKQSVKVKNKYYCKLLASNKEYKHWKTIKNNQACKAEITKKTAIIIELIN